MLPPVAEELALLEKSRQKICQGLEKYVEWNLRRSQVRLALRMPFHEHYLRCQQYSCCGPIHWCELAVTSVIRLAGEKQKSVCWKQYVQSNGGVLDNIFFWFSWLSLIDKPHIRAKASFGLRSFARALQLPLGKAFVVRVPCQAWQKSVKEWCLKDVLPLRRGQPHMAHHISQNLRVVYSPIESWKAQLRPS